MKQKTRIFIYILVAIAVVILGGITIINNHQPDNPASAQEHIDFGRIYLADLSWEKAVLEFTEAIEIEPLNSDAYLGLAEAYVGIGDMDKAIEVLEEGYDKTGDERLKDMLEELQPPVFAETIVVTTTATTITTVEETTTISTAAMVTVPDLSGLTEEEAIAACESAGLKYNVSYGYSDEIERGYVIGQTIPVNASVAEGISVPFTVSEGVEIVTTIIATTVETTVLTTTAPAEEFIIIKGAQYSTSLTELDITGFQLTNDDIRDLYKMKNLKILWLGDNQISDISVLENLVNLEELILCQNQISDISPLKKLTNLKYLDLWGNQISDISSLEELKKLKHLELYANLISDISVLENLTSLESLYLISNPVKGEDIDYLKTILPNCFIG